MEANSQQAQRSEEGLSVETQTPLQTQDTGTVRKDAQDTSETMEALLMVAHYNCSDPMRYNAINTQSFKAVDCYLVYESMWNSFCESYCITQDYWPTGLSKVATSNSILDLALFALSAKRLSYDGHPELRSLSYEAYGRSLALFRSSMSKDRSKRGAISAVISLIYSVFEGSSVELDHIFAEENGAHAHMRGAMLLMNDCDPQAFASPGFHEILQKIRENGVIKFLPFAR